MTEPQEGRYDQSLWSFIHSFIPQKLSHTIARTSKTFSAEPRSQASTIPADASQVPVSTERSEGEAKAWRQVAGLKLSENGSQVWIEAETQVWHGRAWQQKGREYG